jgi:4-carboxymuconolactone decarboxylase
VQPGTRPELAEVEGRILAERGRVSLLYQVLLNSGPIASGWERMLTAVRNQTSVPGDLRELIILRVAVLNRAASSSMPMHPSPSAKVSACQDRGREGRGHRRRVRPAREQQVLALTDAMTRDVTVPDALMAELQQQYDPQHLVELVATVAAYNMVSRFLVALNVSH